MKVKFSTLILLAAAMVVSCSKQDANGPRKDSFELYPTSDCSGNPLEAYCVDVKANTSELFLKTNVSDFEVFWQDALLEPWAILYVREIRECPLDRTLMNRKEKSIIDCRL